MKVLVAAYACEPGRGSEPLVGWRWIHEIRNLGHDVWVMTRANNRAAIEAYERVHGHSGIHYIFIDLPFPLTRLKKLPGGIYPFYYGWQFWVLFTAWRLHRKWRFDRVHQLTFVSIRFPTFLGLLGAPLWVGPLGGGERSPRQLRAPLGFAFTAREWFRDVLVYLHALDPFRALGLSLAQRIMTTTDESTRSLPFWLRKRCEVYPAIASEGSNHRGDLEFETDKVRLLYAGLHKDWKGLRLGLRALARVQDHATKPYHLTVVGRGPDHQLWRQEVERLGISDRVTFIDWMPRDELLDYYANNHAFLYPSMHDSGGLVVWEALSAGLPVICLKCGGPSLIVTEQCGYAQKVAGQSYEQIIDGLVKGLLRLQNPDQIVAWSHGARQRSNAMTWSSLVRSVYSDGSEES